MDPLEPTLSFRLTKWDRSVLATLDEWAADRAVVSGDLEWRTPWQVSETLREDDVRMVRETLLALVTFGYATTSWWGPVRDRRFIATPWRRERADTDRQVDGAA